MRLLRRNVKGLHTETVIEKAATVFSRYVVVFSLDCNPKQRADIKQNLL